MQRKASTGTWGLTGKGDREHNRWTEIEGWRARKHNRNSRAEQDVTTQKSRDRQSGKKLTERN